MQVSFTDQSTSSAGSIVSWNWSLGSNNSSLQNPSAIFNQVGSFEICLTVTDSQGNTGTLCQEDYINIYDKPTADFVRTPISGCTPLEVTYTNNSLSPNGALTQLVWDIGGTTNLAIVDDADSIISTTYTNVGNYKATLFITDEKGCTDTKVIDNAVETLPGPMIDLDIEIVSACELPWEVKFNNNNPDPATTYSWNFGNGTTYEGASPQNIMYNADGSYEVVVALNRNGCLDTLRETLVINASGSAQIEIEPQEACAGTPISFTEISPINPDSIFWNFGDGNTSNLSNPSHTYAAPGCYDITMIRHVDSCVDTVVQSCITIAPTPTVTVDIANQYNCQLPTQVDLMGSSEQAGSYMWTVTGEGLNETFNADTSNIIIESFGEYSVDLVFTSDAGCIVAQNDIPIEIKELESELPSIGPSGCKPLTFTLSDSTTSSIAIVDYEWIIGAPINVTLSGPNPSYTIDQVGEYDVILVTTNAIGCKDTIYREDYIRVGEPVTFDFDATPKEECILAPKQFTAFTGPEVDAWVWGTDGTDTLSTLQNPIMYLSSSKLWDISLTVYYNGCPSTLIKEDFINILDPTVSYKIEYNCDDPYLVTFDANVVGADSSYWEIEVAPGVLDTFFNVEIDTFRFPERGRYHVQHYAVNYESGCEHFRIDTVEIAEPIASFEVDTLQGCSPLTINITGNSQDALHIDYVVPGASVDSTISVSNPTLSYTENGVFTGPTLIVTDIHGCQDTLTKMDSVLVNKATAIADHVDFVCIPDSVWVKNASTDRLGEIVEQRWYFDGTLLENTQDSFWVQIEENRYYELGLSVTDDWGCVDSVAWNQAIWGSDIDASFASSDTLSCTTHAIAFALSNADQPDDIASYAWDFGDGQSSEEASPTHLYTQEGAYTVCLTLTNTRGCTDMHCMDEPIIIADPVAAFVGDPLFETCPPLLSTFQNQSINSTSFSWDFGDNSGLSDNESPAHLYNQPGSFDVTLIASSTPHCADTLTRADYVVVEGPTGTFTMASDSACVPLTIELYGESDDEYFFSWDFGNGATASSGALQRYDTVQYVYQEVGSYLPKLILTDGNGCARSFDTDSIHVNNLELNFANEKIHFCDYPTQITLENLSSSTDPSVVYEWHVGSGADTTAYNTTHLNLNLNQLGTYHVSLIGESENCIDTLSIDSLISVGSVPVAAFEIQQDQVCELLATQFNNQSSNEYGEITSYAWDFGDGQLSADASPDHTYTNITDVEVSLHITTEFGCVDSTNSTITILPNTLPVLPDDYTICIGDSVQLLASLEGQGADQVSFTWSNNSDLSCVDCYFPFASPTDTATYILTASHSNGCISHDTTVVNVVPVPGPELALSLDTLICLDDSATISITNYDPSLNYSWHDQGNMDCTDCPVVNAYPETNTYYSVTVTNEYGCFENDSIFVEVERQIDDFLVSSIALCEGNEIELSIADNALQPQWRDGSTVLCVDCNSVVVTPTENQYYYVDAQSAAGCDYTDSIYTILVPDESISISEPDTICLGESIKLSSQGFGQSSWTPAEYLDDPNNRNPIATPQQSATYTVSYTLDECTLQDSVYIHVLEKVEVEASSDTVCLGEEVVLRASGLVDEYRWYSEGQMLSNLPTLYVTPNEDMNIMLVGSMGLCENDTVYTMAALHPLIDVELLQDQYTLYVNSAEKVQIEWNDSMDYTYVWSPANGLSCDDCPDPKIDGLESARDYELLVTDNQTQCFEAFNIYVRRYNYCSEKAFYIPNIFSPNGDGHNDQFSLIAERPEEFEEIQLFDRWGNKVFGSDDVNFTWDGIYLGDPLMSGVYAYVISYTCKETGEQLAFTGDVTIIR